MIINNQAYKDNNSSLELNTFKAIPALLLTNFRLYVRSLKMKLINHVNKNQFQMSHLNLIF